MQPVFAGDTRAGWSARLEQAGIPHSPVRGVLEAISDPQARALDLLRPLPGGDTRFAELPLSFDGERPASRCRAPRLGEHNDDITGRS